MRKPLVAVLAVLLLSACSSGGSDSSTNSGGADGLPGWLKEIPGVQISSSTTINGRDIYVDEKDRTLYMKGNCDDSERGISEEGDPFGPKSRDEDPSGQAGYGTICVD